MSWLACQRVILECLMCPLPRPALPCPAVRRQQARHPGDGGRGPGAAVHQRGGAAKGGHTHRHLPLARQLSQQLIDRRPDKREGRKPPSPRNDWQKYAPNAGWRVPNLFFLCLLFTGFNFVKKKC